MSTTIFTQTNLKSRGVVTETVICHACRRVIEVPIMEGMPLTCPIDGGVLSNHAEFLMVKTIARLNSYTLSDWRAVLIMLVVKYVRLKRPEIAGFLARKLVQVTKI